MTFFVYRPTSILFETFNVNFLSTLIINIFHLPQVHFPYLKLMMEQFVIKLFFFTC